MAQTQKEKLMEKEKKQAEELKRTRAQLKQIETEEKKKAQEEMDKALFLVGKALMKKAKNDSALKEILLNNLDGLNDRDGKFVRGQLEKIGL
ncbi:hypothetical protein [Hydrogenovibrio marinus]|uniref:Mobilization protein n=1 Tax=Hydrogenovibrio marinus TaxID=28885 RepID=A0A066ZM98_HYDMR|nr:hypothetical protein [Hydrogenovibrio marinus]KDN94622.1 hypothetical protein EI16_12010 [Hydrogenovibrio marinus]